MPPQPTKKKDEEEEYMDLWNDAPQKDSRNIAKFKKFTEQS